MKILVLSLMRIGDSLFHQECLSGLQKVLPKAQVDYVIHDNFMHAAELFPKTAKVWFFPRKQTEKVLVGRDHIFGKAIEVVCRFTDEINAENYDLIINLTHSMVAAKLMDMLEATKKIGPRYQNSVSHKLENEWDRYFQATFKENTQPVFHYVDFLTNIMGIPAATQRKVVWPRKIQRVIVQPLTSDEKKNWSAQKYNDVIRELKQNGVQVKILCAPQEESTVRQHFTSHTHDIVSCDFRMAKNILAGADVLITGDTAILHLANQIGLPVLGLYVGSANPSKTAPYAEGHRILNAKSECSPCGHQFQCDKNLKCQNTISANDVLATLYSQPESRHSETLFSIAGYLSLSENKNECLQYLVSKRLSRGEVMTKEIENQYRLALSAVELQLQEMRKKHPYGAEIENLQMIYELIKEQVRNENTSDSTRTIG